MASVLSHPSPWCFWRRQDALPMCVVTGQHMVKEDWCICPRSRMPALMSHYESYLQYEQVRGSFHRQTKLFRSAFLCCLCLSFSLVPFEPPLSPAKYTTCHEIKTLLYPHSKNTKDETT